MGHCSYLLRLWQVSSNGEQAWRILLENVQTGEKRGFASLEELLAYLRRLSAKNDDALSEGSHNGEQG
jgi:hypothetical protein